MANEAPAPRLLLLLRHAQAVDFAPGLTDVERPLTEKGVNQATAAGEFLRSEGIAVDVILCSPASRTRETASALALDCVVTVSPSLYNAGSDALLEELTDVPDNARTVLLVGHAPGVPSLAHSLTDHSDSDAEAVATIARCFPTGTLVGLEVDAWSDLSSGRLRFARLF